MDIYSYYGDAMDEVFQEAPSIVLEELLGADSKISAIEILTLSVNIEKKWQNDKKYNVQFGIIIDEKEYGDKSSKIYNYDFGEDIKDILENGDYKSIIYIIDLNGNIIKKQLMTNSISFDKMCTDSFKLNSIAMFLGINGVDILIKGKVYKTKNHLNSYGDMIYLKWLSITEYKKLLEKFFVSEVQYDPFNRYFAYKKDLASNLHEKLDKHTKLLRAKPEKIFQDNLEHFLKDNCTDNVLTEVHNKSGDRYDVWVSSADNKLYVFELKWLGKSITADGSIFSKYNKEERAIEGAYQIKDYIDNAEKHANIFADTKIHCGVLVVFDCREEMDDLKYPNEFQKYKQIDLTQHYKVEKEKISASSVYKHQIKNNA